MMMEPTPMLFLVVPLMSKAAFATGMHWITLNFMLLQYSAVAFITPPLAMGVFVTCQMFKAKVEDVTKGTLPFFIILVIHLLLFLFLPDLLLWLPRLVYGEKIDMQLVM